MSSEMMCAFDSYERDALRAERIEEAEARAASHERIMRKAPQPEPQLTEAEAAAQWYAVHNKVVRDSRHKRKQQAEVDALMGVKLGEIAAPSPNLIANKEAQERFDKEMARLDDTWRKQWAALTPAAQAAWIAYHYSGDLREDGFADEAESDESVSIRYILRAEPFIQKDYTATVQRGLEQSDFANFRAFNDGYMRARAKLHADLNTALHPEPGSRVPFVGATLTKIAPRTDAAYLVPDFLPTSLTILYGEREMGKSLLMQRVSAAVAFGGTFNGLTIGHGKVIYVTRDVGAEVGEVAERLAEIVPELGLVATDDLVLIDDPLFLDDPITVDDFLTQHPGRFALVIIDPLFMCTRGRLIDETTVGEAVKGIDVIRRATGAAVVLVTHEPGSGDDLYGSRLWGAAAVAIWRVTRKGNVATVTCRKMKNRRGGHPRPWSYRLDDGATVERPAASERVVVNGVAAVADTDDAPPLSAATAASSEAILERMPSGWASSRAVFRSIRELLPAGLSDAAARKAWGRIVARLTADGLIEKRGEQLRRTASTPGT